MLIRRSSRRAAAPVSTSWKRLEQWLEKHFPGGLENLHPGASEAELAQFERAIEQTLPDDVRESWRIHNGEEAAHQGVLFRHWLSPLQHAEVCWRHWQDVLADQEAHPESYGLQWAKSFPAGAVQTLHATRGWIPLHDWDGNHIGVDLNPGPTGIRGQVISFGRDIDEKTVLALSWAHFLEDVADELEAGNFVLDVDDAGRIRSFSTAEPAAREGAAFGREWAEAKLPRLFQNRIPPPAPKEQPVSSAQKTACVKAVQGLLDALLRWEMKWLARRPLKPLGLVRLEEVRGKLTRAYFQPEKGLPVSGDPAVLFDPKFWRPPDIPRQLLDAIASHPCGSSELLKRMEEDRARFADGPRRLLSHPFAQICCNPERYVEFTQGGKTYEEAMAEKRQILKFFAPDVEVPEVFVQTEPPTYRQESQVIAEVTALSPTHCLVYLEPVAAPDLSPGGGVTYAWPADCKSRQIRYHVVQRDADWIISSREISLEGRRFVTLSF